MRILKMSSYLRSRYEYYVELKFRERILKASTVTISCNRCPCDYVWWYIDGPPCH